MSSTQPTTNSPALLRKVILLVIASLDPKDRFQLRGHPRKVGPLMRQKLREKWVAVDKTEPTPAELEQLEVETVPVLLQWEIADLRSLDRAFRAMGWEGEPNPCKVLADVAPLF